MTVEQTVMEKLRELPLERQQEVLDFVESLQQGTMPQQSSPKKPRQSLKGLWADLDIHITDEDITEARREMWGNFPRDDF